MTLLLAVGLWSAMHQPVGTATPLAAYDTAAARLMDRSILQALLHAQEATVGLWEVGTSRYIGTGVRIGPRHVLTARHNLFQRAPSGGSTQRALDRLRVVLDSSAEVPRAASGDHVVRVLSASMPDMATSTVPDASGNPRARDYAVLEIDAARAGPVSVLRPSTDPVAVGTRVFVIGQAWGGPQQTAYGGTVLFPDRVRADMFQRLLAGRPAAEWPALRDAYRRRGRELRLASPHLRGAPAIGIAADVMRGMSGGPVLTQRGTAWFGILVDGQPDRHAPYNASWRHHELVLPLEAIFADMVRRDAVPPPWRTHPLAASSEVSGP